MNKDSNITGMPVALQLKIKGTVQGVGFRPFVYRTALELGVHGCVKNTGEGATIFAEGAPQVLKKFIKSLYKAPFPIRIDQLLSTPQSAAGLTTFKIDQSDKKGAKNAWTMPDMATCPQCLEELFNPRDRRYLYPFINCTHCGPRYSIIEALPYDRPNTSMKKFVMCPQCRAEYYNPANRRFHAQPNACPVCGPHLELWNAKGKTIAKYHDALVQAAKNILAGKIVAVKGIGGFQLFADAAIDQTIQELRERKQREAKPLALMFPDMKIISDYCEYEQTEANALQSPQAPIVLLLRRDNPGIAPSVAPDNPYLGAMLPCSPLHHILMKELGRPVVATSGNLSDEPICIDNHEALSRLYGIADFFLVHNRPVVRHVDDSVVKTLAGGLCVLRRARGYAPLPVFQKKNLPNMVAVGGHLKNTISLSNNGTVFTGQHIGDLETEAAYKAFTTNIADLDRMYPGNPVYIVHDKHPDYQSTQYAQQSGTPTLAVQHHAAHVYACMAEHALGPPVLGFSWDGTGYGDDGTIWGGEAILVNKTGYERAGHLLPFTLPGGEQAIKNPWRTRLGLLHILFDGNRSLIKDHLDNLSAERQDITIVLDMLDKDINCPVTSSAGRLFDAAASMLNVRHANQYEGQAAMQLEYTAMQAGPVHVQYPYDISHDNHSVCMDWRPLIRAMLNEQYAGVTVQEIAARFHMTLAGMICKTAQLIGIEQLVLTGGVFQNRLLTENSLKLLQQQGFQVFLHRDIPPNDGGISTGQILAADYMIKNSKAGSELCV